MQSFKTKANLIETGFNQRLESGGPMMKWWNTMARPRLLCCIWICLSGWLLPGSSWSEPAEQRLDRLEQELEEVKKQNQALQAQVEELEGIVEDVEQQSLSDRLQWNAELRITHHNFTFNNRETDAAPERIENHSVVNQLRVRLNVRSVLRHNMRFTGRLSVLKNWGESFDPLTPDPSEGGVPGDAQLNLERAYLDYFINETISFSAGRLPGADGPPSELAENTVRKSTYPISSYNIELDGVVLTFHLPAVAVFQPTFRLVYGEFSSTERNSNFRSDGIESTKISLYQLETDIQTRWFQGLAVYDYLRLDSLSLTEQDFNEFIERFANEFPDGLELGERPNELGGGTRQAIHFQFRWKEIPLDTYATYVSTQVQSNGKRAVVDLGGIPVVCVGLGQPLDCDEPSRRSNTYGYAWNTGARYQISWEQLNRPKLGIDYHRGNRDHLYNGFRGEFGVEGNREMSFYNVRGTAIHVYWIQPLEPTLFVRVGRQQMDIDYTNSILAPEKIDRDLIDWYVLLDAKF